MKEVKRSYPFLLAIPALILLALFEVWPFILSVITSFQRYSPKDGIFGSELVGMKNYIDIFSTYYGVRLLRNTLVNAIIPALVICLLAVLLAMCLHRFPNRALKCVGLTILLIPALIPSATLAGMLIELVASDGFITSHIISFGVNGEPLNALSRPEGFMFTYYLAQVVTGLFWPTLLGLLVLENGCKNRRLISAMAAWFLLRMTLLFVSNDEIILAIYNPLVYEKADVFSSFIYRKGLQEANMGYSNAIALICMIPQLIINFFVFKNLDRFLTRKDLADTLSEKKQSGLLSVGVIVGFILLAFGSIAFIIAVFFPSIVTEGKVDLSLLFGADYNLLLFMGNSLIYGVFGTALFLVVTALLAYPLLTKNKLYAGLLFVLLAFGASRELNYSTMRMMGLANTGTALVLVSAVSIFSVFALHWLVRDAFAALPSFKAYLKAAKKPLIVMGVLCFIGIWCSYYPAMIYLNSRHLYPLSLILRELLIEFDASSYGENVSFESLQATVIFISSLPPIIIGTVLLWVNKKLPLSAWLTRVRT